MIVGIVWIGVLFYFVWLENNFNCSNLCEGLFGDFWVIYGGGIYYLEKYKLVLLKMLENLYWFKWEVYFIWMFGVVLLIIVFYLNLIFYLIVFGSDLVLVVVIVIGIGLLVCGWFVYIVFCDLVLGKIFVLFGLVLFVLLVVVVYGLIQVFSGCGVYLYVGVIIGIIMVGNVFRVIMLVQCVLVKVIEENCEFDLVLLVKGLLCFWYNNYFILLVLFIMISNYFLSIYGSQYNWLILVVIVVFVVLVCYYFNICYESNCFVWVLFVGVLGMIVLVFVIMLNYQQVFVLLVSILVVVLV